MNEKFLKEKKSQKILLSVMAALILILAVCAISTADTAIPENALTQCEPERIQDLDNGVQQIYFNIDQKNDGDSLVFFTLHQYVDVFADGERIYSLNQTGGVWGHTTGYVWCFVKLPKDVKQMEIRLTPCYPEVAGQMREYYIGSEHEIYRTLLRRSMPEMVISVFIFIVGAVIALYWTVIHKSSQIDGTLLYFGTFSILLGLWSANETDVAALVLLNRQASAFAAFALLMAMPLAFILFIKSFLDIKDEKYWKIICSINILTMAISYVLNFTGIYEFRRSLWITHVVIILLLIYLFVVITGKIVKHRADRRLRACVGALVLIIAGTVADLGRYYKTSSNAGVLGKLSFLIFIIVLGIESAKQAIESLQKGRRAAELEQFALNDSMTGLYNRNAYNYFVKNRQGLENYMIVTFDLNNLKSCNDNYGHSAGDVYIIHSAHIIESIFERFGKCYRIGGDEFCCIIPKANGFNIERFVQKLKQEVEIFNNKNIIPVRAGIACGYAFFRADDTDIEKVRERADEMMYQNKKKLKGQD